MTLHQLKVFQSVANRLSVSRAAVELNISQPSVSQALRLLEEEFGLKFYQKTRRGVKLTEDGIEFLRRLEPILERIEQLRYDFDRRERVQPLETLTVGAGHMAGEAFLSSVLSAFKERHSRVELILHTDWSPAIEQMVLNRDIPLGILIGASRIPGLIYEPIGNERVVFAVSRRDGWYDDSPIASADLGRMPFVIWKGDPTLKILGRLKERGFVPNVVMECETLEGAITAVRARRGVGIFLESSVETWSQEILQLNVPSLKNIIFEIAVAYHGDSELPTRAAELLQLLRSAAKSRTPPARQPGTPEVSQPETVFSPHGLARTVRI